MYFSTITLFYFMYLRLCGVWRCNEFYFLANNSIFVNIIRFAFRHFREEYRCTLCPYTCTTEKAFVRHLRHCESNEYSIPEKLPVSCPVCGKDRPGKQILEMHMEKHKDNKYFCCDICSFRTVQLKKVHNCICKI